MSAEIIAHPGRQAELPKPFVEREVVQELEELLSTAKRGDMVNVALTYVDADGSHHTRIVNGKSRMLALHSGIAYLLHRMNTLIDNS